MSVWPRNMSIVSCEKLEVAQLVMRDMMQTSDLEELRIDDCEGLTTTNSFPPNLTSLTIYKIKNCKALMEFQGSHILTSLRELYLWGERDQSIVSFPPGEREKEMMLPTSLVKLDIRYFRNLKKLKTLYIFCCPKLTTIPEEEGGLPASFTYSKLLLVAVLLYSKRNTGPR
ncbi:hypothetical protein ACLB2K_075880 [Fragaria x ananassa]